jgi:tRNA threonylcarbamoyladenosine biosynthesis protein TsaB
VKILAIESSTDLLSVALLADGSVIEREGERGRSHSDLVLPLVRGLLGDAGLELAALDGIAFGAGPGSFTGLRLACGVAQGLAFGAGLRVLGVGSMEALALDAGCEKVYACVDARMNEAYCAAYRVTRGSVEAVIDPVVAAPNRAPLPEGTGWHGCGNGFLSYGEALHGRFAGRVGDIDAQAVPRASAVARLAAQRFVRGEAVDVALAAPLYVRDKVALTTAERIARGGKA